MGIMSDEQHPDFEPLINDEELDNFWDQWGWTNQLYFIACENEDDDRIVRANNPTDAVKLFRAENNPHHRGRRIAYVYQLPTQPGLTRVLNWREHDLPSVEWSEEHHERRGKR